MLFLISIIFSQAVSASAIEVFNVTIGGELPSLPACHLKGITDHSFENSQTCFIKKTPLKKAWGSDDYDVLLPSKEVPGYLRHDLLVGDFSISVVDGRVESLAFATNGYLSQEEALRALIKKFGNPTQINKVDLQVALQNAFGATISGYKAKWLVGDVSVTFDGVTDDIDWGRVEVSTKKYNILMNKWKESRKDKDL